MIVWMYLCTALRYFRTKFGSKSLVPSLVHKVWKVLVKSVTAWPLSCHSVVHVMYWLDPIYSRHLYGTFL